MFCPASSGREPEFWEAWNRSRGHPRSREGQEVIAKNSRILTSLLRIRIPPGSMWEPSAVRGSEGLPFCYECSDKSSALIHLSQGCRLKRNRRPSKLLILSEPAFLARCPRRSSGNRSGPAGGGLFKFPCGHNTDIDMADVKPLEQKNHAVSLDTTKHTVSTGFPHVPFFSDS